MTPESNIAPLPCDLLIRADAVITQDDQRRVLTDAAVVVTDGLVVRVDDYETLEREFEPRQRLDMSGKVLMPGLVNGHTHLPMNILRGFGDDLPLIEWLEEHMWPVEHQMTPEQIGIGARLGCAELIRTGCTAFFNGYFAEDRTGRAASEAGLRAVLGEGFFSFPSPFFPTAEDCWQALRSLHDRWVDDPLITDSIFPHAAFTVKPEDMTASFKLAEELDIPWQIHLAESPAETSICLGKYGKRPVELLDSLGLLTERTRLHHCVDVEDREIERLAETGTKVVHNPASNLKLCSGISPVQKLLDAGVTLGLGTDGAASNNQLNMFRDMGLAALIGKVRHRDASAVNAQAVLDMATRNSAACLGLPELGRIEAGHPADIIALDFGSPNLLPVYNHISHVVYATTGHEVCMTMVAGQVLYLYGEYKTLDMEALRKEAADVAQWVRQAWEKGKNNGK